MGQTQNSSIHDLKHLDWGTLDGRGLRATGRQVQDFIKQSLQSRIGYVYEYKNAYKYLGFADEEDFINWRNGKNLESKDKAVINRYLQDNRLIVQIWELPKSGVGYIWEGQESDGENYYGKFFGFIDEDKYNEWISNGRPLNSELIQQSWISFRPNIKELENKIENESIGYVYEDNDRGRFLAFSSEDKYNEWLSSGDSNLILAQWSNSNKQGIPIYTKDYAENHVTNLPDDYITFLDETDVTNSVVQDKTYNTSINGPLANILFSAIRALQSEVAKIKNTFNYGLRSYSGTNTVMSREQADYDNIIEKEPLWAVDENDLSLIEECMINDFHTFVPKDNVTVLDGGALTFNSEGASWYPDEVINEVEDSKLFAYITSSGKNIQCKLIDETEDNIIVNFDELDIPVISLYNILLIISRKQVVNGSEFGNNFIWISIDNGLGETIAEGYYNNGQLYPNIQTLEKRYSISEFLFKDLTLTKLNLYSKYQDFTQEVIPSKPLEQDNVYKVAHITIRSVKTFDILKSIQTQLLENEPIFVEDSNKLYIKNNGKLVQVTGASSPTNNDDNMTQEEIIQILKESGIVKSDNGELSIQDVLDITFIHQDSGAKFKLIVESDGSIRTIPIIEGTEDNPKTLQEQLNKYFGESSVGTTQEIRGFVSRLRLKKDNTAVDTVKDVGLRSDRVKIGSFYGPARTNKTFGCSHCFIELENTSTEDFPLDGCYLHFARNVGNAPQVSHLALTGVIPAGGTYLIRGKQLAEFDDPNTFIKVTTFDQEWYENKQLIDLTNNGEIIGTAANDPHGLALTYQLPNLQYDDTLYTSNAGVEKAPYKYSPNYIDAVYYNSSYQINKSGYWVPGTNSMLYQKNGVILDCIYKNTFELDPAKQAYQALNTYDSSRFRNDKKPDYQYLYLGQEFIEFPHSKEKYPVSKFTPKASYEHKNVCTDKTQLDVEKPNMVTCSFGKNPYTTRCFNWVSGGLFDEYVFIKQGNSWKKFESYKEGDESKQASGDYPRRKEFNDADVINYIYKRITGRFPAANTQYTAHKCIINIVENAVQSPTTYTYIVGRSDINGNPDLEHCSEEYTFTLYPSSYTPRIYQITDQQGFHWVEYQSWAASAEEVNRHINEELQSEQIIPVLVNTGDMTQSGARINEWLDYYNAGKSLFKHLEQVNVVGNNDLCGSDPNILGTGDDLGKSNAYYFHVFYCYEVEVGQGLTPIINNKYVPSLYQIDFTNYKFLLVNSEITKTTCSTWFNLLNNGNIVNAYTGWTITEGTPTYISSFTSVYTMIYNMTSDLGNKELIAFCHEMPFTVITHENLADTADIRQKSRSISGTSLVGSHLNQMDYHDKVGINWFSRLLEFRKCKLCIGGHKHTYAITYPLRENYYYENGAKNSKDNGPMEMTSTLVNETSVRWTSDLENQNLNNVPLTKLPLVKTETGTYRGGVDPNHFAPGEFVTNFQQFKLNEQDQNPYTTGVIYFMCQATGFKQKSNKELPSTSQKFSQFIPKSDLTATPAAASNEQQMPMYAIFKLNQNNPWSVQLIRLNNIQSGKAKLLTQLDYGKQAITRQYLYDDPNDQAWPYGSWGGDNVVKTILTI